MGTISFARGRRRRASTRPRSASVPTRRSRVTRPSSATGRPAGTGRCGPGSASDTASTRRGSALTNGSLQGFSSTRGRCSPSVPAGCSSRRRPTRPAAHAPRRPRGRRRGGAAGRGRARPRRARGGALPGPRLVPLHDPDVPEPKRPHAAGGAPAPARRARPRHDLPVLEDDPYGLVRYEGDPPPLLHELEGGELVTYTSRRSPRPSRRGPRRVLRPARAARGAVRARRGLHVHHAGLARRGDRVGVRAPGRFEPNLVRVRGLLKARRDAMLAALDRELGGRRRGAGPRAATSSGWISPTTSTRPSCWRGRRRRASRSCAARTSSRRQRRRLLGAAGVQLRLAGRDRRGRLAPRLAAPGAGLATRPRAARRGRPAAGSAPAGAAAGARATPAEGAEGGADGLAREGAESGATEVAITAGCSGRVAHRLSPSVAPAAPTVVDPRALNAHGKRCRDENCAISGLSSLRESALT